MRDEKDILLTIVDEAKPFFSNFLIVPVAIKPIL